MAIADYQFNAVFTRREIYMYGVSFHKVMLLEMDHTCTDRVVAPSASPERSNSLASCWTEDGLSERTRGSLSKRQKFYQGQQLWTVQLAKGILCWYHQTTNQPFPWSQWRRVGSAGADTTQTSEGVAYEALAAFSP
jgi:hypothetical protein